MKKKWSIILIGGLLIVMSACGTQNKDTKSSESTTEATSKSSVAVSSSTSEETVSSEGSAENPSASEHSSESTAVVGKYKVTQLTEDTKQKITEEFLNWAGERAKEGGMAVTDRYFDHGASGMGDWYAESVDGKIQVQEVGNPGYNAYEIHAVGGVAFFIPLDGAVGISHVPDMSATASGYSEAADSNGQISKYLLADNGIVYELKGVGQSLIAFSSGFGLAADDGSFDGQHSIVPNQVFQVSQDNDAQAEYQRILSAYQ
ncbi:hypothetical protein ACYSNR_14175 [Enterococcus sp. LJL128]|uniref:hypothetical protein n=1 Tax=Enterococcus sp. LJL51 TaxID=3416656 RepID=UPI003CF7F3FE